MNYFLFRKLNVDDKDYYQFYKVERDFKPNDDFTTFDKRKDKDFFYVKESDVSINDDKLFLIFEDKNGTFTNIDDVHTLSYIYEKFKEKFEDLKNTRISITELKPVNELVDIVNDKIKFQKESIKKLIEHIYRNQMIMGSNLSILSKKKQKNNLLLFGRVGHGKKTIIRLLENNLNIPYADIEIPFMYHDGKIAVPGVNEINMEIAKNYLLRCTNNGELNNGIVFLHVDSGEMRKALSHILDDLGAPEDFFGREKAFVDISSKVTDIYIELIKYISNSEPFTYRGNVFDFRTMTFVVTLDKDLCDNDDLDELMEICNKLDCFAIPVRDLTNEEKFAIISGKNGILQEYKEYLRNFDKKFMISKSGIKYLIEICDGINPGIPFLNNVIGSIVKLQTTESIRDVMINEEMIKNYIESRLDESYYEDEEEEVLTIPPINNVFTELKKKIVGQDNQLKNLLYNIIRNRRMADNPNLDDPKQYIKNILIRGESGGGKTFIISNIAKKLNIPCYIADATQFTEAGYVGADVTDMLVELYRNAGGDLEEAEKGILVIDEIDKKANDDGRSDVSRGAVLNGLLKIIEGSPITINVGSRMQPEEITFDTSRLTVICSGAFENIEEYRDARIKKQRGSSKLGFSNAKEEELTVDADIIDKDYVSFGMIRQFMARIPVIINLNKNTKESLKNIIINSTASALKIEARSLLEQGIILEYTDDFYDRVAEEAIKLDIGVRGVDKVLQRVLTSINIQDIDSSEVQKIILNASVIDNPSNVILIPRNNKVKKLTNS